MTTGKIPYSREPPARWESGEKERLYVSLKAAIDSRTFALIYRWLSAGYDKLAGNSDTMDQKERRYITQNLLAVAREFGMSEDARKIARKAYRRQ
jgi:hypothetical protein